MSARRLAFARARWPVAVAMRVVAASLAEDGRRGARRSVFAAPRRNRRVVARDASGARRTPAPRGCEDLH